MKGLWLENRQLQLRTDIPIPEPPENEALVRVLSAGIRHQEKLANLEARGIKVGFCDKVCDTLSGSLRERSFDIAVECTGNDSGFDIAHRALRPRGILVLKSTYAGKLSFDASALVVDEITLIGSRCGPFAPALELLAQGKINVEPLIQARFPLADGISAFEHAQTRGVMKVLLEMS